MCSYRRWSVDSCSGVGGSLHHKQKKKDYVSCAGREGREGREGGFQEMGKLQETQRLQYPAPFQFLTNEPQLL